MGEGIHKELIKQLTNAHAMEKQAIQLLDKASRMIGDEELARIFRAHRLQTEEHARYVGERLEACGEDPSKLKDAAMQAAALGIGVVAAAAPDTPARLAKIAFSFEHFEIASYGMIRRLAERDGDTETVAVVDRILEQEEAAAELIGSSFDRVLDLTLGEPARSPLPSVTPIGKPSEREHQPYQHGGPQDYKDKEGDASLKQPEHVSTSTHADHLGSPDPGHPVDETTAHGTDVPRPEDPQTIGTTTPNQDRA